MFKRIVVLLVLVLCKISANGQSDLNILLNKFEQEVNSGYLEIESTFINENFLIGNNGTVHIRVYFIIYSQSQICYILDYGSSIYIADANGCRLFRKSDSGFNEIKNFTDPRQFNNLLSFLLNRGYRMQVKQNAHMYDFISESGDIKLWSLNLDKSLESSFEVGFSEYFPTYVCSNILMRGVYQTRTQRILKSQFNHLSQIEYYKVLQDYQVNVIDVGVEN